MTTCFIEPVDVLYLRGNKLFGDPGSYGESQIPPWPSVAAGAIRSMLLARDGGDFDGFVSGEKPHSSLGTAEKPGSFRITGFGLARRMNGSLERIHALPADLVLSESDGVKMLQRIRPRTLHEAIQSSFPLEQSPVLAQPQRGKPLAGYWLNETGWRRYLAGETPSIDDLIATADLWVSDERVGVGLDPARRRADDGKLFSIQGAAFRDGVGFGVEVEGAELPERDMLRFGGDGRGALLQTTEDKPATIDFDNLCQAGRGRIILTSPGLFDQGWCLPGMDGDGRFELAGVKGRVVAAAVSRAEVVSGWDLARWQPKPARRAAPTGSVYWLEDLQATPEALRKLADHGQWPEHGYDEQRRVEGFNRFVWGAW